MTLSTIPSMELRTGPLSPFPSIDSGLAWPGRGDKIGLPRLVPILGTRRRGIPRFEKLIKRPLLSNIGGLDRIEYESFLLLTAGLRRKTRPFWPG